MFQSRGKWLYPLFELEEFLESFLLHSTLSPRELLLHDHIAGRAAAALICRLGFTRCHIDTVSIPALKLFEEQGVLCRWGQRVGKIQCKTEEILTRDMNPHEVYALLKQRAGLIQGLALSIKGLWAGYGEHQVLKNLDLELKAGEKIVITGENGAGKTTLLKVLGGSILPRKGQLSLGGQALRNAACAGSIAYVNQSSGESAFPMSALEVVSIGSRLKGDVEAAMRRCGCFHLAHRNFYTLSGGERQRVSLARCLCQKAGLILLDEPSSFLDRESKKDFLELLLQVSRNQIPTIMAVSHDHQWAGQLGWPVRELKEGRLC